MGRKLTLCCKSSCRRPCQQFQWSFCLLVLAALTTAVWSALSREREEHIALHKWFRVFLRLCLAATIIGYGMVKVVPLQMPYPYLTLLLRPFGSFSPMNVLWSSVGAAPGYEIFAGCAELLAGLLLLVRPHLHKHPREIFVNSREVRENGRR